MEQVLLESLAAVGRRSEQRLARLEKLLEELIQRNTLSFEATVLQQQVASGATMQSPDQAVSA